MAPGTSEGHGPRISHNDTFIDKDILVTEITGMALAMEIYPSGDLRERI